MILCLAHTVATSLYLPQLPWAPSRWPLCRGSTVIDPHASLLRTCSPRTYRTLCSINILAFMCRTNLASPSSYTPPLSSWIPMKLTETLPLLFSVSAATATKVLPRSLASSGTDFASRSYDYVIIGGGTAGLTVAARLTEDPNVSVGVIEAGEYLVDDAMIDTPANAFQLQGNPKYDWNFQSVPQPNVNGRALNLPRGKVLGGSSAINIMVLDRASKVEYDSWEGFGNPGWNWNGLLPYMKAAEHFTGADPFRVNNTGVSPSDILPSQGTNGPIAASYNSWYSDIIPPFHKTMKNLGVPMNFDPDSGDPFGTYNSPTAVNRTTGKRSYAASTYYAYNAHRSNLVVLTGAHATKIQFDTSKTGGKVTAKGVSFTRNSTTYSVSAKKEVILSAGSFQTPQLLELSGIGDSTILRKFGITPLVDLPGVGENLQDHTYLATNYELKPGFTTLDILQNNATYAAEAAAQYATTHDGIFAVSGSIVSFIDLDFLATPLKIASMTAQLLLEIVRDGTNALQKLQYAFQLGWLAKNLGQVEIIFNPGYAGGPVPKAGTSYAAILLAAQHPFSRGSVHINSSDPLAPPRIDPQYFSKSFDLDVFVQAVKLSSKIAKTEPLASAIVGRVQPAPEVTSDDDITQYIKDNVQTIYHPIGTAVMAPQILGGVVDPNLKVYGTSNLRVIDASIIPTHMGTHLQRTVYGIAEKAAEIIKKGSS